MESKKNVHNVHYVIVVHGIGEQRPNETILPVINRFAEARENDYTGTMPDKGNYVSMGKVAAQVGTVPKVDGRFSFTSAHPWAQFKEIPVKKGESAFSFTGEESSGTDMIRFVDFCWSDILEDYFQISGQGIGEWTDGVISRMTRDHEMDPNQKWVIALLEKVQETALFAQQVAALPKVNMGQDLNYILDHVVGDIQIYGENRSVRGEAVKAFHNLMEKLNRTHCKTYGVKPTGGDDHFLAEDGNVYIPQYTVIAHSLGTVISMDALLYAHLRKKEVYGPNLKENKSPYRNLPFEKYKADDLRYKGATEFEEGFQKTDGEFIGSNWIDNIRAFVTLGSPIDKYLTLWPENYDYLEGKRYEGEGGAEDIFYNRPEGKKIPHFNYCDEQDPVGHHLDVFAKKTAYSMVFEKNRDNDVTYNKYVLPGIAHVMYWDDQALFQRILHQTIDQLGPKDLTEGTGKDVQENWSTIKSFWKVIGIAYFLPAFLAGIVISIPFYWGWDVMVADFDWKTGLIMGFIFSMSSYLFMKLINLFIFWRQILRKKSKRGDTGYFQKWSSAIFRMLLLGGNFVLIGAAYWIIPAGLAGAEGNKLEHFPEYLLLLLITGIGVHIFGKLTWARQWVNKTFWWKRPETYTVLVLFVVTVFMYYRFQHTSIVALKESTGEVTGEIRSFLSVLLAGWMVAWMYTTFCLLYVKKRLMEF